MPRWRLWLYLDVRDSASLPCLTFIRFCWLQFRPPGPPPPGQQYMPSGGQPYRPPGPPPGMGPQLGMPPNMQGMGPQNMPPSSQPPQYSGSPMQQMPPRPPQQGQPQSSQGMAMPYSQQPRPMSSGPPLQQQQQPHNMPPPGPGNPGMPPPSSFGVSSLTLLASFVVLVLDVIMVEVF